MRRRRARSWRLILAGAWLAIVILAALFAPLIAPHDPLAQDLLLERLPPVWLPGAEPGYLLGTDGLGRDVLSRLIYGSRIALTVAFIAAPAACIIGSVLGLLAGYYRGWLDQIVSRIVDIWMAFPPVLFSILLVAVLGTGLHSVIIAIVAIDWIRFCRVVRAETLHQRRMDYVDSARVAGFSHLTILLKEVLPERAAGDRRAAVAGDGDRRHRRGDPLLREPLHLHRRPDLGRHDRRGPHHHPFRLVGARLPARSCSS